MRMVPQPGIALNGNILRLYKALYSLKKAPVAWFEKLSEALPTIGFIKVGNLGTTKS